MSISGPSALNLDSTLKTLKKAMKSNKSLNKSNECQRCQSKKQQLPIHQLILFVSSVSQSISLDV